MHESHTIAVSQDLSTNLWNAWVPKLPNLRASGRDYEEAKANLLALLSTVTPEPELTKP